MIPNIIHFCYGFSPDLGGKPFSLVHYLAVRSAVETNRPDAVRLYYKHEPRGVWWDRAKRYLDLVPIEPPTELFGVPVRHHAHQADWVRLEALYEHGGIYLDLDVLCLRSFAPLRHHETVLGQEGVAGEIGLCNAVILARPGAPFIRRWMEGFDPATSLWAGFRSKGRDAFWNEMAVRYPAHLARLYPDEVRVARSLRLLRRTRHYGALLPAARPLLGPPLRGAHLSAESGSAVDPLVLRPVASGPRDLGRGEPEDGQGLPLRGLPWRRAPPYDGPCFRPDEDPAVALWTRHLPDPGDARRGRCPVLADPGSRFAPQISPGLRRSGPVRSRAQGALERCLGILRDGPNPRRAGARIVPFTAIRAPRRAPPARRAGADAGGPRAREGRPAPAPTMRGAANPSAERSPAWCASNGIGEPRTAGRALSMIRRPGLRAIGRLRLRVARSQLAGFERTANRSEVGRCSRGSEPARTGPISVAMSSTRRDGPLRQSRNTKRPAGSLLPGLFLSTTLALSTSMPATGCSPWSTTIEPPSCILTSTAAGRSRNNGAGRVRTRAGFE